MAIHHTAICLQKSPQSLVRGLAGPFLGAGLLFPEATVLLASDGCEGRVAFRTGTKWGKWTNGERLEWVDHWWQCIRLNIFYQLMAHRRRMFIR